MKDSASSNKVEGNVLVDLSNPFFLHHSDHPRIVLVTKLLNGDNYGTWSRSMSIALSAKNKTGFVDGSFKKPPSTNEKSLSWKILSVQPNLIQISLLKMFFVRFLFVSIYCLLVK